MLISKNDIEFKRNIYIHIQFQIQFQTQFLMTDITLIDEIDEIIEATIAERRKIFEVPKLTSKMPKLTLYKENKNKSIGYWTVEITVWKSDPKLEPKLEPITNDFQTDQQLPDDYYAQMTKISGLIGGKQKEPAITRISTGRNIGRKNATNVYTQALSEANSEIKKKFDHGYRMTKEEATSTSLLLPMQLHQYEKHGHKIKFPAGAQPKLDGVRAFVSFDPKINRILFTSRNGPEDYEFSRTVGKEMLDHKFFSLGSEIRFDGELYKHGTPQGKISGIARRRKNLIKEDYERKATIQFWIFDFYDPQRPKLTFLERYTILVNFCNQCPALKYTKLVPVEQILKKDDVTLFLDKYIDLKFEGVVIRNFDGVYTPTHRSYNVQKFKKTLTSEFAIVGANSAKGSHDGAIMWILQTPSGGTFDVTPTNCTIKERIEKHKDFSRWPGSYIGKMITVYYQVLSEYGIPIFGRCELDPREDYDPE